VSSTVTIGFLDRASVCIQAEFTPPLADDERRELLIHATLLTGRAFASLTPDRQRAFAGVLREWTASDFDSCPLQSVAVDPMACPHRFASTFLAPVREYALATTGCGIEAGGIDYFLPMAAAAYLRYVADTDDDPEELLKPALALCAAATIHPITVDNHFEMAAASLPKVGPIIDRTVSRQDLPFFDHAPALPPPVVEEGGGRSSHHLRETRRSLIVSACLAAVLIVLGVQYLSTRDPRAGGEPVAVRSPAAPKTLPKQSQEGVGAHRDAPSSEGGSRTAPTTDRNGTWVGAPIAAPHPPPKPLSPTARAYLREVRDLAENSLAQVEVMLAVIDRAGTASEESADTFEYGIRQLRAWRQQFTTLSPPGSLARQHRQVEMVLKELGGIAGLMRSPQSKPPSGAIRDRLSALHAGLERVLSDADGF
jgi:hypothetical protein